MQGNCYNSCSTKYHYLDKKKTLSLYYLKIKLDWILRDLHVSSLTLK